jgi:hypothetical protein
VDVLEIVVEVVFVVEVVTCVLVVDVELDVEVGPVAVGGVSTDGNRLQFSKSDAGTATKVGGCAYGVLSPFKSEKYGSYRSPTRFSKRCSLPGSLARASWMI